MKLLNPSEIKADKQEELSNAHLRTQKLALAEGELAREVNIAREGAKTQIEAINARDHTA